MDTDVTTTTLADIPNVSIMRNDRNPYVYKEGDKVPSIHCSSES